MKTRRLLIGVLLLGVTTGAHATVIYDAADDFTATTNSNSVWSYGYYTSASSGDPATFANYSVHGKALNNSGDPTELDAWKFNESGWSNVIHNPTDTSITEYDVITWAPNALTLFSNNNSQGYAVVRWTAPANGTIDVSTVWTPLYTGQSLATEYAILGHGGSYQVLYSYTQMDFESDVWTTSNLNVVQGDTLDFAIVNLNLTQLDATITMIPEPTSMAILVSGMVGLLAYAWRRK